MSLPLRIPRSAWKSPVRWLAKAFSVLFLDGMWFSGRPEIEPIDFDRDFAEIEKLLLAEQWPFVRADLEISHAQPRGVALVARKNGQFAGFYAAHHFGDVGYLDMCIIAPEFRKQGIGRPLHARLWREMKRKGLRSFVVHTTNDSAPMMWILGFDAGQTFTLLARDAVIGHPVAIPSAIAKLAPSDLPELIALDREVFAEDRTSWIEGLMGQPTTEFWGLKNGKELLASVCLRARRNGALCMDAANSLDFVKLQTLFEGVLAAYADRRLECFVRDDSDLARFLPHRGFAVPEFFKAIGPLTEWRKSKAGLMGRTPHIQCLSWF